MLKPIDDANIPAALKLLQRGFPHRSSQFWEQRVQRVGRYNRHYGETSIGKLLTVGERPVGVALTIVDQCRQADGKLGKVVNLSSWYVDPEFRHQAPLMLRDLVRDRDVVYTDLTPSDRVAPMLPLLGFRPLNVGIAAVSLPTTVFSHTGKARVSGLASLERDVLSSDTRARMERNIEFGALAAVLSDGDRYCPLLFVPRTLRRIPVAQLVYCEDNALFRRMIGAVAQFLMKKGKLALIIDIPLDYKAPGVHFLKRGLKFAKGGCFDNRTDYAGSELIIVGQ